MNDRNKEDTALAVMIVAAFWLGIIAGALLCSGCTTVPMPVASHAASFDGDAQTSGVLAVSDSGYVVTQRFRERFNDLVVAYGHEWSPALTEDAGLARRRGGDWICSKEAMEKFLVMNAWHRMRREPKP